MLSILVNGSWRSGTSQQ